MQRLTWMLLLISLGGCMARQPDLLRPLAMPEQRTVAVRDPAILPVLPIPQQTAPRTVADLRKVPEWRLSLDEAIKISLENARVVRVLTGLSATASGRTIYDPAITNTAIDQEKGRFDSLLSYKGRFNRTETPTAFLNPLDPTRAALFGTGADQFESIAGLTKTNVTGGQLGANWTEAPTRFGGNAGPFALNPQNRNAFELSYTQPLMQGAGFRVNTAPIVIARINTEFSFFQYKDTVQEMVRGVIEGYWNLVQARTDAWARRIQVEQTKEQYEREKVRLDVRLGDKGTLAQARVSYTQFKANLVAAEAAVLAREGALRNLLGLPPNDDREIVPVSAPTLTRMRPKWKELINLAEERRPDLIELKLIFEADQVRLTLAENSALPRVDAATFYRWNGLAGTMPNGERLATGSGQFTDWSIGVNFSVPLGLRQGRAKVRESSLVLLRDRANLDQGVHAATHELAISLRELDSSYEQYLAFKDSRIAAYDNLKVQIEQHRVGRSIYLNVLQALNDWGNAVTSEVRAMLNYNITLATLERQTGTILETHGLVFFEERFRAAGPLGRLGHGRLYPSALPATGTPQQYPATGAPSEQTFDLKNPAPRKKKEAPPPAPLPAPGRLLPPLVVPALTAPEGVERPDRRAAVRD
ncbi:MAG: TolC family protein [Planctomycetes bacterium]|nr:TolC family protein [Planctomycetota bacterium]